MTAPTTQYSQQLFILLDSRNFTSSQSIRTWLTPENAVRLSQLCAIVNLVGAQQGLSKAVLLVKGSPTKDYAQTPSLKEYYIVMQNARCVLDTMKFVHASLEKGLMIAKARKNEFEQDILSLEMSQAYVSFCVAFWKSDKIYDPLEISSFIGKIIDLRFNNPETFENHQSLLDTEEGGALQALIDSWKRLSRQINSHKDNSDSISIRSNKSSMTRLTAWSPFKSHMHPFEHVHFPHIQLDGLLHHLPHLTLPHLNSHLPHILKPNIQLHLPGALADHSHGLDVPKVIHSFFSLSAHDSHDHGSEVDINPSTLAKMTQTSLQKVLKWCHHRCQSPSSVEISSKISEETINYAYAIDQSTRASILILLKAHDALSIHHKVDELTREDIQTLHDLSVSASEEQEKTSSLFNIVDQDVCELLKTAKIAHDQEKLLVDDRSHEFEHNNKALEILKDDVGRYIRWWIQASMDFNYEIDSCDAATLNESVLRRKGILDKWKEIRGYFTHYPEKMNSLKETFQDLFDKAHERGPPSRL